MSEPVDQGPVSFEAQRVRGQVWLKVTAPGARIQTRMTPAQVADLISQLSTVSASCAQEAADQLELWVRTH